VTKDRRVKILVCDRLVATDLMIKEAQFSYVNSRSMELITGWYHLSANYRIMWSKTGQYAAKSTNKVGPYN